MIPIEDRVARLAAVVAGTFSSGQVIGFGSGSTAEAVVRALGQRQVSERAFSVTGVATSIKTRDLGTAVGITMIDLADVSRIDVGFDGADEIDPALNLVKGKGGALLYEKLVAEICDDYVVVSSDEKLVERLGTRLPLPVEVIAYGCNHTSDRLRALGLDPVLRLTGPDPYLTDAGNYILDCTPSSEIDLLQRADQIKLTTGVVEHGIFSDIARRAMLVNPDGEVSTVLPAKTVAL